MYVDDRGTSKGLPSNKRASDLISLCGMKIDVRGDSFVARMRDDPVKDEFSRVDFTLADMQSDAAWIRKAKGVIDGL